MQQRTHSDWIEKKSNALAILERVRLFFALAFLINTAHVVGGGHPSATFAEEALSRGLIYPYQGGGDQYGSGVAFADLDSDGDDDVVLTGHPSGMVGIFENNGSGYFSNRSQESGISPLPHASGIVAGDFDADGLTDLYITQWPGANLMAKNMGSFRFEDVTVSAGLEYSHTGTGPTAGDYDSDGYLDIYVPNYFSLPNEPPADNLLYHNEGDGTFINVAPALGVDDEWRGLQGVFFDYDLDGDVDLYLSNDKRVKTETVMHNRLWRNDNGEFVDVSDFSNTDVNIASMGVAVGDLDQNGFPDIYCTNLFFEPNPLLLNQGDGTFVESAALAGVESWRTGWGALFVDYDHDRFLDLFVCNAASANRMYDCNESFPCVDVAEEVGLALNAISYCLATSDIDNDGDLDFLMQTDSLGIRLYINRLQDPMHWIKVRLRGNQPNLDAVGATIFVRTGDQVQQRQVISGMSFKSHTSLIQHFGLGDADIIDELQVLWPGGTTTTLSNVATNQTIEIIQPPSCTPPLPVTTPMPRNGMILQGQSTTVQWLGASNAIFRVYFGETFPLPKIGETTTNSYSVTDIEPGKTYHWRIDTKTCALTEGPVWSFSTLAASSPDSMPPTIVLTSPSSAVSTTDTAVISLSGSAHDDTAVNQISWSSTNGGGAVCNGTSNWVCGPIDLFIGTNRFSILAIDTSGLESILEVAITYTPLSQTITDLAVSPAALEFSPQQSSASLLVSATSDERVSYTVRSSQPWMVVEPPNGMSFGPRDVQQHTVNILRDELPFGALHEAMITIASDEFAIQKEALVQVHSDTNVNDSPNYDVQPPDLGGQDNEIADGGAPRAPFDENLLESSAAPLDSTSDDSQSQSTSSRSCGILGFVNLCGALLLLRLALHSRRGRRRLL